MDISKKLIIDREGMNEAIGFCIIPESGEKTEVVLAGKNIIPVPESERTCKIYKLLEENCDVIFCTNQVLKDFSFYPVPQFWIFAVDSKMSCFVTIGGIGSLADDNYPVGYVDSNGIYGKVTNSLKEFFELVTFYPYWRDIIRCERMQLSYAINDMEKEKIENSPQYFAHQREIAVTLNLSKNQKVIELLISNIKSTPGFMVYASKEEASKIHF